MADNPVTTGVRPAPPEYNTEITVTPQDQGQVTESTPSPSPVAGAAPQTSQATQPTQPTQPTQAAPVSPEVQHTGRFHKILSALNQGDRQVIRDANGNPVTDPTTGQVKTSPMTSKQLGRSILAGVLSAMATAEQNQPYMNGNGQWVNPTNQAVSAARGAFAAGRPRQQFQQATEQANKLKTQQYATYEANLKMLTQTQQLYNLKSEQMSKAVDYYKDLAEQFSQGNITGPNGENLYDANYANMTPQEMEDHIKKGDFTRDLAFPVSTEPILDDKGMPTGQSQLRWAALKGPANVTVTKEMAAKFPEQLSGAENRTIPLLQYLKIVRTAADYSSLGSMIQNVADQQVEAEMPGAKPVEFDWKKFQKDARLTPDQVHQMHALAGMPPDQFMAKIREMDKANAGGGRLAEALSKQGITIDTEAWKAKRSEEEAGEKSKQNRINKQQDLLYAPLNDSLAEDIKARYETSNEHGNITDDRYKEATKWLTDKDKRESDKAQKAAEIKALADTGGPEALRATASDIVDGRSLGNLRDYTSMRGAQKMLLNRAIQDYARSQGRDPQLYSPAALESRSKMYLDYTEGKTNQTIGSFDAFLRHVNDGIDAIENMKTKGSSLRGFPLANRPLSWLAANATGDQDYIDYVTKFIPVAKEFQSFLNSNRAEHTEDIAIMNKILNDSTRSPSQNEQAIRALAGSADKRLAALADRYQKNMLQPYPDIISKDSIATLKRLGYADPDVSRVMREYKPEYGSAPQSQGQGQAPPPPPGFSPVVQQPR